MALKILAGSAAVGLPVLNDVAAEGAAAVCHMGRTAARVAELGAHAPKFFDAQQIQTLTALSETIIPADEHSPGARAARVYEYIDDIIADSSESLKSLWTQGLAAVDKIAQLEHGKKFAECAAEQQVALLEKISQNEERPTTPEERFFVAVKKATIDGYYTSAIGIHKELEYQGNTALLDFPGCTHEEHKAAAEEKHAVK